MWSEASDDQRQAWETESGWDLDGDQCVGEPGCAPAEPAGPENRIVTVSQGDGSSSTGDNSVLSDVSGHLNEHLRVGWVASFNINKVFGATIDFGSAKLKDKVGGGWTTSGYVEQYSEGRTLASFSAIGLFTVSAENTTRDNGQTWAYGPLQIQQGAVLETLSRKPVNYIFYFDQLLNFFLDQLNTFTVASIIYANKDYSQKSFLYVRCGIIAKGKDHFEKIKDKPYLLEDAFQLKGLLDIASKAYKLKMEGPADNGLSQASAYNF